MSSAGSFRSEDAASVVIRDLVPQDAEKALAFRKRLFGETDFLLYSPSEYSATVEEIAAQLERVAHARTSRSLIAEDDGRFVGFLSIVGSPIPRLQHAALIGLGVLRDSWGRGVATALMGEAIRWAPTAGLSRLELSVMATNVRAMALYERLGFRLEGHRACAYMVDGKPVDDYIMGYVLS